MSSEDKRFFILIGMIIIVVVALSVTARFLGTMLWGEKSLEATTILPLPADSPEAPSVDSSHVTEPVKTPPPKAPIHVTAKGRVPPEFQTLESQLTAMEQTLSRHAQKEQALKEKVIEIDGLISRTEGIVQHPDPRLSAPLSAPHAVSENEDKGTADVEHLRERLEALRDRL
ncbi:MAG: hypothetical protein KJO08_07410 [Gammaproteobacteria bacterium]|nr:hypothetical protein [Gammaproteobacteria bacterium]